MGYYSQCDYGLNDAKVDVNKIKAFEDFFANDKAIALSADDEGLWAFFGIKLDVNNEGELEGFILEDYYGKFYDDRLFANKLSEILISGTVRLTFTGEDGEKWSYNVSSGKVEELYFIGVTDEEYGIYQAIQIALSDPDKNTQLMEILKQE